MTQELVDFRDVYGEFDNMLRPSAKRKYAAGILVCAEF